MKTRLLQLLFVLSACIGIYACSKSKSDSSGGTAYVSMRLTDAPGNYDAVYIDIQQIGITISGRSEAFIAPFRPGVYNLLSFRNGMDTLLANANIPAGNISQIRLVLGSNNFVVVGGVSYPMSTPSAQESGLKLNLQSTTLAAGVSYTFWIDFDAGKSVLQTGNGSFKLKPVIRAYSEATNGKIVGYVMPVAAFSTVYAIKGSDTSAAIPDADGHFVIGGLASGNYLLLVEPAIPAYISFNTRVDVTAGASWDVGTITLQP